MLQKLAVITAIGALTAFPGINSSRAQTEYNPRINPADFVAEINNKYFTLKPGKKFSYRNSAGTERVEQVVTRETKKVMGVTTIVVRATEWKHGVLAEDTRDWYAQDKDGNVWYFGEAVDNYTKGQLTNHDGSWEAGVDGAQPGIIMLAHPRLGETYRQEYYKGKAEDMGSVVGLDKKVKTAAGTFDNCLQTKDWTPLEKQSEEHKYYCPAVGFVVLEVSPKPRRVKMELVGVSDQ
jgi:hypothetical protein